MGRGSAARAAGSRRHGDVTGRPPKSIDGRDVSCSPLEVSIEEGEGALDLEVADDSGHGTEHSGGRTGHHLARLGRPLEEAAKARASRRMDSHDETLKPNHSAEDRRDPQGDCLVVDDEAGLRIVGRVEDHVDALEQGRSVVRREPSLFGLETQVWEACLELRAGGVDLRAAHIRDAVQDLPLKIRQLDVIIIHEPNGPHAGLREAEKRRTPEAAGAHNERTDMGSFSHKSDP